MSGHSKWATIKRKKGAADTKRGQAFTKLANAISIAVRDGDDPEMNFKLRLAIDKAKTANMPYANIDKAIARGSGKLGGERIEEVLYEGYGPGSTAILAETATDNRNRTSSDVRSVFNKHGGNLAESGAVSFQFERKGVITIESADPDEATLIAIDAGAEDIEQDDNILTVYTPPKELHKVTQNLTSVGLEVKSSELAYVPKQTVLITDAAVAQKAARLLELLEELDDVTATYTNLDVSPDLLDNLP